MGRGVKYGPTGLLVIDVPSIGDVHPAVVYIFMFTTQTRSNASTQKHT